MMDPSRRLCYYASLRPWLFGIITSLVFVMGGVAMYLSPRASHPEDRFMAVICVAFFGLGVVLLPVYAALDRRQPVLTLTPAGLQTREMPAEHEMVGWAEVTALGIYRGERWSKKSEPEHYLIALGRPGARSRALEAADWAAEDWEEMVEMGDLSAWEEPGAVDPNTPPQLIMLSLNQLFATTNTKRNERRCEELMDEIAETFAPEVDLYKITIEREIQPLSTLEEDG